MLRLLHTPDWLSRTARCAVAVVLAAIPLGASGAQGTPAPQPSPLLDALSITVRQDSGAPARGTVRFRQVRTGADVELVATGIVVRKGLRVTAELRTDSAYQLRRYVTETRDTTNRIVDRIQVTSAGGRVTLERVTPTRRSVREFLAQRDLVILDSLAIVPFVVTAALGTRSTPVAMLDVRRTALLSATLTAGAPAELVLSEVAVSGTPITATGLSSGLRWWRDARGRLLRVAWTGGQVLRDDPPT